MTTTTPATPENLVAAAKLVRATVSAEARRISYAHQMERYEERPRLGPPAQGFGQGVK